MLWGWRIEFGRIWAGRGRGQTLLMWGVNRIHTVSILYRILDECYRYVLLDLSVRGVHSVIVNTHVRVGGFGRYLVSGKGRCVNKCGCEVRWVVLMSVIDYFSEADQIPTTTLKVCVYSGVGSAPGSTYIHALLEDAALYSEQKIDKTVNHSCRVIRKPSEWADRKHGGVLSSVGAVPVFIILHQVGPEIRRERLRLHIFHMCSLEFRSVVRHRYKECSPIVV